MRDADGISNVNVILRHAKTFSVTLSTSPSVPKMDEETKIRTEAPDETDTEEIIGIAKPLPVSPESIRKKTKGKYPIVKFLGISMRENRRDLLIMILIPAIIGLADANIFSLVTLGVFPNTAVYIFVLPMLAAIPAGLVIRQSGRALFSAFVTSIFFILFYILFLSSPALFYPIFDMGTLIVSGGAFSIVFFIIGTVASLLGVLIGLLLREFF